MIPARMDLEAVLALSKSLVTMPAARPYAVPLALLIASATLLWVGGYMS